LITESVSSDFLFLLSFLCELHIGSSVFVGTHWPVSDNIAFEFVKELYNQLYNNTLLGKAIRMTKMNGFELGSEIRKIDDKIKIIFITAYDFDEND